MKEYLNAPIDSAALIFFRFFTGILLVSELINGIFLGKISQYTATYHFSYLFTPFITPLPFWGLIAQYVLIIFSALCVSLGKFYRVTSVILFLSFTHLFLSEMSEYINHAYLYCLMLFWLMILPLGEKEVSRTHPRWMLLLILFHVGLTYFFAGIAKLNSDWLNGTPMDIFLAQREGHLLGFFYKQSWAPLLFSWGGLFFDLFITFFLIIPFTRKTAFIAASIFHLSNVLMFGLASFPWYCLLLSSLFFSPSWPRKIILLKNLFPTSEQRKMNSFELKGISSLLVTSYCLVHLLLPFRHLLSAHSASWSEEAHQFSWRMMLRTKSGETSFIAQKEDGKRFVINPRHYLTSRQYEKMKGHPDMILQFAHLVAADYKKKGEILKIFCLSQIALNHHPAQALIDSSIDLTREPRSLTSYSFIRPQENTHKIGDLARRMEKSLTHLLTFR